MALTSSGVFKNKDPGITPSAKSSREYGLLSSLNSFKIVSMSFLFLLNMVAGILPLLKRLTGNCFLSP